MLRRLKSLVRLQANAKYFTNAQLYIGLLGIVWGIYVEAAIGWWLLTFVMLIFGTATVSAGLHRYFGHRSFEVNKFWYYFFTFYSLMVWLGSPLQWNVVHTTHHRWSDTDRDPHPGPRAGRTLLYLFYRFYKDVPYDFSRSGWIMKSKLQKFVHRYYGWLAIGLFGLLFLISPYLAMFGMMIPAAIGLFIGGIHNTLGHWNDGVNFKGTDNYWWAEYFLPQGGDWIHGRHHENPGIAVFKQKWYELDTGGILINLIRTDK